MENYTICPNCSGIVDIKQRYSPDYQQLKCRNCNWGDTQSIAYAIDYLKDYKSVIFTGLDDISEDDIGFGMFMETTERQVAMDAIEFSDETLAPVVEWLGLLPTS